jgi:hypothetical protein
MRAHALPVGGDDRGAADDAGEAFDAACDSKSVSTEQVPDADGHRLSERRHEPVPGAPMLAAPSLWRWAAAERWVS